MYHDGTGTVVRLDSWTVRTIRAHDLISSEPQIQDHTTPPPFFSEERSEKMRAFIYTDHVVGARRPEQQRTTMRPALPACTQYTSDITRSRELIQSSPFVRNYIRVQVLGSS